MVRNHDQFWGKLGQKFQGRAHTADSWKMNWISRAGGRESIPGRGDNMMMGRKRTPRLIPRQFLPHGHAGDSWSIQAHLVKQAFFFFSVFAGSPTSSTIAWPTTWADVFALRNVFLMCSGLSLGAHWLWSCPAFRLPLGLRAVSDPRMSSYDLKGAASRASSPSELWWNIEPWFTITQKLVGS